MHNGAEMRTQRQIEASRINGAKSRGPVTHAGRQKSSRNSRRHCLYAKDIQVSPSAPVQPGSGTGGIPGLVENEPASPCPVPRTANPERELLMQAVLDALQERMRIVFLETRVMEEEIARQRLIHPAEAEIVLHERAFRRLANETGTLHALYRFEGAAMRRMDRALQLLSRCPQDLQTLQPVSNPAIGVREIVICETNPTGPLYGDLSSRTPTKRHHVDQPKRAYNRLIVAMAKRIGTATLILLACIIPTGLAQAPTPTPAATMKQIMLDLIHPASNDIILTVNRGGPSDDKEWAAIRRSALALAESGNTLAARVDSNDWRNAAKQLGDAGSDAYKAAQAKDAKALAAVTPRIDASCTNCHKQFRPNVFPRQAGP
jgi:hypothetical protein